MKLGEIKTEAMLLMFPDIDLEVAADAEYGKDGSGLLLALASDTNYTAYMKAMPGAINRCFSYLEGYGAIPQKSVKLTNPKCAGSVLRYEMPKGVFCPERVVYCDGDRIIGTEFDTLAGDYLVVDNRGDGEYILIYTPYVERVSVKTDDMSEVDLPDALCCIIPYFLKSELFVNEDAEEAASARAMFERSLETLTLGMRARSCDYERVYSI